MSTLTKQIKLKHFKGSDYHLVSIYSDTTYTVYNKKLDLTFGYGPNRLEDLDLMLDQFRKWGYSREKVKTFKAV